MRGLRRAGAVWCVLMSFAGMAAAEPHQPEDGAKVLTAQTRVFLDAYAKGDEETVLGLITDDICVYGSDVAEYFRGPSAVRGMIVKDMKLWGGAATIGPMQDVSVVVRGELGTVFFDAPFSAGGRPAVVVRFATVWRWTPKGWLLAQSSNTVPTTGQSAAELLRGEGTR